MTWPKELSRWYRACSERLVGKPGRKECDALVARLRAVGNYGNVVNDGQEVLASLDAWAGSSESRVDVSRPHVNNGPRNNANSPNPALLISKIVRRCR